MSTAHVDAVVHEVTRLNIATGIDFDEFTRAFEDAAPAFDPATFQQCTTWTDVVETMASFAPHGLARYARIDTGPIMAIAGTGVPAIEYLLGNHVIAETMFRHDANAMLYAPLRVLVFADSAGDAVFAIDRPSTVFAGLNNADIARTGHLLDGKVAGLLRALGVEVGDGLIDG